MFEKIKRKLLFSIGLGAVVFLAMSIYADFGALKSAFERFEMVYVVPALILALVNYFIRFFRWQYYLGVLKIPLGWRPSLTVFLAGLILSVTPGKAGELLKAYFIRERLHIPISQSASAVVCERLTDLFALILLAVVGISTFRDGLIPLLGGAGLLMLMLVVISWSTAANWALGILARIPFIGRLAKDLKLAYKGMRLLIMPRSLILGIGLGVIAWFAECLGFVLVLIGFGATVGVIPATFIYSFATLFGAMTMLPGGLGSTEASMSGFLVLQGVPLADSVGATFVTRICTLWFAVAIGAYVLLRYRESFEWEPEEASGVLEESA